MVSKSQYERERRHQNLDARIRVSKPRCEREIKCQIVGAGIRVSEHLIRKRKPNQLKFLT